jgi:hypothetical protein
VSKRWEQISSNHMAFYKPPFEPKKPYICIGKPPKTYGGNARSVGFQLGPGPYMVSAGMLLTPHTPLATPSP